MSRMFVASLVAGVLLAAAPAAAQEVEVARGAYQTYDSSRDFLLEVNGGYFAPDIDSSSGVVGTPYQDIFGKKGVWTLGFELGYELWQAFGTVGVALAADWGSVGGKGLYAGTNGTKSADDTSFNTVPVRVLATYRFDVLARRWGIPVVPFGKVGLAYTFWWITKGDGGIATDGEAQALGGKWGYELAAGLALELNFFDPMLGRELDEGFGINSVYLQGQFMRVTGDNFGKAGLDVSSNRWMFGLGFEF
jgi:hypothetical protein